MPVSKMEESIEARYQASLKTAQNPNGEPFPAYHSGKSEDETSGKTGSGKKFRHSVILGTDSAAQPFYAATFTPVIHLCTAVWKLMKIQQVWDRIQSQFRNLYTAKGTVGGVHGNNRLSGKSLLDCMVFGCVTGVLCARYVSGCSEKEDPYVDVSALWKISVDIIGALTLLSIGDFFVEVKKPSEKATEALYQTLSLSEGH